MKRIGHRIENGEEVKWCGRCQRWLSLTHFSANKVKWDGLQERCNECRKVHYSEVGKFTKTIPPLEVRRQRHRVQVIKSYGITEEEFNSMLERQGGKCAICGTTDWGRPSPSIDHDHKTGKVRALLCNRCNRVLGLAEDSPELLSKMFNYLKEHGTEN
nr:MAG TPA: Recombination endonuclease VII [Crassvirales sp.]